MPALFVGLGCGDDAYLHASHLVNGVVVYLRPHKLLPKTQRVIASSETYHIVGSAEADPAQGLISNESPLGRALMGLKVGETAEVNAPDGVLEFKIVGIK